MKRNINNRKLLWISYSGVFVLAIITTICATLLRKNTALSYKTYYDNLKAGYIAEENVYVKSPIDIIDEKATEIAKEEARKASLPVFTFSTSDTMSILSSVNELRNSGKYSDAVVSSAYNITDDVCSIGLFKQSEIEEIRSLDYSSIRISNSLQNEDSNRIVLINDVVTYENLSKYVIEQLYSYSSLSDSEKREVVSILMEKCHANIHLDEFLTIQNRTIAENATEPVVISLKRGDILIEKDKVIQQSQLNLIEKIQSSGDITPISVVNDFVLSLIFYLITFVLFYNFAKGNKYHNIQYMGIFIFFGLFLIVGTYFELILVSKIKVGCIFAFIPTVFLPILITDVTGDRKFGLVGAFFVAAMSAVLPSADLNSFFYCLLCATVAVMITKFVHKRLDTLIQILLVIASNIGFTVFEMYVSGFSFIYYKQVLFGVIGNVVVSQVLISVIVPVLEKLFNLPTQFRMHELAYSDSSLLKRLYQAAPGTYNHSRQVAELAQAASEVVGANPLISRVGSLYHDIGKTDYPEYFVENQNAENKHDDINPSLSASIIKSHVKVGYDKGKEAKLPIEVLHIIESHHGNDVISYFYREALKEENEEIEHVQSEDYSYNSPIPESKECAIVMLADSIEAASRTISEPTPAKFSKLIDQIVLGKIERGQLDNSQLSMNELELIKKSFMTTLSAMYHSRIKYQDEEED